MDIDLSPEDLSFQEEVRAFFTENAYRHGDDYNQWRLNWFELAREKGGWDVPKWPTEFGGPGWTPTQHYIWEKETATAQIPWDLPFGLSMLAPVLMKVVSMELERIFEYRAKVMAEMFGGSEDRACVRWVEGGYVTAPVGAP